MKIPVDLPTVLLFYTTSLLAGAVTFLYVRRSASEPRGLLFLAISYFMLAIGALLAWLGELAGLPIEFWTHGSLALGCYGYAFFWAGMRDLCSERMINWLVAIALPTVVSLVGFFTDFPLRNLERAEVFHCVAIISLILSIVELSRCWKIENLPSTLLLKTFLFISASIYISRLILILDGSITPNKFALAFFLQMFCHYGIALMVFNMSKERTKKKLAFFAETDPLTGVGNRRWFSSNAPSSIRENSAVFQLDIDHFKMINDQYGHGAGGLVLATTANCIKSEIRKNDLLARMGGEEFMVYAPDITRSSAIALGERIRKSVEQGGVIVNGNKINVTISVGIAWVSAGNHDMSKCAIEGDNALYQAKRSGRNQVAIFSVEKEA